jgi:hypothetical protein
MDGKKDFPYTSPLQKKLHEKYRLECLDKDTQKALQDRLAEETDEDILFI